MQEKGISYQLATNSTWLYRSPQRSTSYFNFISASFPLQCMLPLPLHSSITRFISIAIFQHHAFQFHCTLPLCALFQGYFHTCTFMVYVQDKTITKIAVSCELAESLRVFWSVNICVAVVFQMPGC